MSFENSPLLLQQLKENCLLLGEDKVTLRRKGEQNVSHLLENKSIIKTLNSLSDSEALNGWNWNDVYKYSFKFLEKEGRKIEKDAQSSSNTSSTQTDKIMGTQRLASSLLKSVLRKAFHIDKSRICVMTLLEDMLGILDKDFGNVFYNYFGADALFILSRLLSSESNCASILVSHQKSSVNFWIKLLTTSFRLFDSPPKHSTFHNCLLFLHDVFSKAITYSVISPTWFKNKISFFTYGLLEFEKWGVKSSDSIVVFLQTINMVIHYFMLDFREEFCDLGEKTLSVVIQLYDDVGASKDSLYEFIRLQFLLHYSSRENSFWAVNTDLWISEVKNTYYSLIEKTCESSGGNLSSEFIEISVSVIRAAFYSCEKNQNSFSSSAKDSTESHSTFKRRRKDNLNSSLVFENIRNNLNNTCRLFPWLKITSSLISECSKYFESQKYAEFFTSHLLSSKDEFVRMELMSILTSLPLKSYSTSTLTQIWNYLHESYSLFLNCIQSTFALLIKISPLLPHASLMTHLNKLTVETKETFHVESIDTLCRLIFITSPSLSTRKEILLFLFSSFESWSSKPETSPTSISNLLLSLLIQGRPCSCSQDSSDSSQNDLKNSLIRLSFESFEPITPKVSEMKETQKPFFLSSELNSLVLRFLEKETEKLLKKSGVLNEKESTKETEKIREKDSLDFFKNSLLHIRLFLSLQSSFNSIELESFSENEKNFDFEKIETLLHHLDVYSVSFLKKKKEQRQDKTREEIFQSWSEYYKELGGLYKVNEGQYSIYTPKNLMVFLTSQEYLSSQRPHLYSSSSPSSSSSSSSCFSLCEFDEFENLKGEKKDKEASLTLLALHMANCRNNKDIEGFLTLLSRLSQEYKGSFILTLLTQYVTTESSDFLRARLPCILSLMQRLARKSIRLSYFEPSSSQELLTLLHLLILRTKCYFENDEDLSSKFLVFILAFVKLQAASNYERVSLSLNKEIMAILASFPPFVNWSSEIHNSIGVNDNYFDFVESSSSLSVSSALLRFLPHVSGHIRDFAALSLFSLDPNKDNSLFERVFKISEELLSREKSSLSSVATALRPFLRSRERYLISRFLFHCLKIQIPSKLITKALHSLSTPRKLTAMAPYLLHEFLTHKFDLVNFPIDIFEFESKVNLVSFFKRYENTLLPIVLNFDTHSKISTVLLELYGSSGKTLVSKHFYSLAAYFLPFLTDERDSSPCYKRARALHKKIFELLGEKDFESHLSLHIGDILMTVITNVYDEKDINSSFSSHFKFTTPPNPPTLKVCQLHSLVTFFENRMPPNSETSLLQYLTVTHSNFIYKTLLNLTKSLRISCSSSSETDKDDKVRSLHTLFLFLSLFQNVSETFSQFPFISWFVTRILVKQLFNNLSVHTILRKMAMKVLVKMISLFGKSHSPSILKPVMKQIVNAAISNMNDSQNESLFILNYFLKEKKQFYESQISSLNDFPKDNHVFEPFRLTTLFSLEKIISNFLESETIISFIDLKNLSEALSERTMELRSLYQESCKGNGFTEDVQKSLLHPLIARLFTLHGSKDLGKRERECVGRCLGDIGPLLLSTHVLQPEETSIISYEAKMTNLCLELLVGDDFETANTAGRALEYLCSYSKSPSPSSSPLLISFSGSSFLSSNPHQDISLKSSSHLWTQYEDYEKWIVGLVDSLLISNELSLNGNVSQLIQGNSSLSNAIFPCLIGKLMSEGKLIVETLSHRINLFFEENFLLQATSSTSSTSTISALQSMLDVIHYLRIQDNKGINFILNHLNYLHVASAAFKTSQYFSTVLYADIWCLKQKESNESLSSSLALCDHEPLLQLVSERIELGKICVTLLVEAYEALGDVDSLYGCSSYTQGDSQILQRSHLRGEKKTLRVLGLWDSLIQNSEETSHQKNLMKTYFDSGLYYTLSKYIKTLPLSSLENPAFKDTEYECAWRLSQWTDVKEGVTSTFSSERYFALKSLLELKNKGQFEFFVLRARNSISVNSLQSTAGVYEALSQFRCLREMELFANQTTETYKAFYENYDEFFFPNDENFEWTESLRLQRIVLLKESQTPSRVSQVLSQSFKLAESARKQNKFQSSQRILMDINKYIVSSLDTVRRQFMEAQLLWSWNEKDSAVTLLKTLLSSLNSTSTSSSSTATTTTGIEASTITSISTTENDALKCLVPQILTTCGQWISELKSESASTILNSYLLESVSLTEKNSSETTLRIQAYVSLAIFCDAQYQSIIDYMNSKEFEDKQTLMMQIKEESSNLSEMNKGVEDRELVKSATILSRHSNLDNREVTALSSERNSYLMLCLQNYAQAFITGDSVHDIKIFRFISLWFSNSSNSSVNDYMERILPQISTFKFIPLLYQLAARMTTIHSNPFSKNLLTLLIQISVSHPYHSIPVFTALVNSDADEERERDESRRKRGVRVKGGDERSLAASKLLELLSTKTKLGPLVLETKNLSLAYIALAYTPVLQTNSKAQQSIPKTIRMFKKSSLLIPCFTDTISVSPTGNYESIVGIYSFGEYFETVGGITAPKKILCTGTDGKKRWQLVKGQDDLRQDAVMQQVFSLMNHAMTSNRIRTYKVVPLSQRSGVLEWCEGALPLKDYLIGYDNKSGAHARYYPKDLTGLESRKLLMKAQENEGNPSKKEKVFEYICNHFHPVMHHFFLENFSTPGRYFERRTAYTRSVATSSMVGYILGIGDRHIQNILIDTYSAEVIHIDFGIAFEQGKILPTPEMIPFRLTRDIVSGFGASGIEGTFRRTCESVLKTLRKNKENILTILQVMIHDPLYNWSLTPEKVHKRQGDKSKSYKFSKFISSETETGNKMAERVYLRVLQKLNGMEEGHFLSVQGQVNTLIQQARNPQRLAAVYPGWSPFV